MTNEPHDGPERFKDRDARSYDALAVTFDRFSQRFTEPTAARLLELARVVDGHRLLDIGTGTGIVALLAAHRVGAKGHVTGVDLSEGMLEEARRRIEGSPLLPRILFQRQDAEEMTLPDASFDRVVSLYTLMHLPHPGRAIAEMHRLLRPGGLVAVAVGARPPFRPRHVKYFARRIPLEWHKRRGHWLVATDFLDGIVAKHTVGTADHEHSEFARGAPAAGLPALLRAAGFRGVTTTALGSMGVLGTAEEFWDLSATFSSFARKRLSEAPADVVQHVRDTFFEAARHVQDRGGKLVYPTAAYIAVARK